MSVLVINIKHFKGPFISIMRGQSPLANPFKLANTSKEARVECLTLYTAWFNEQIKIGNRSVLKELYRLYELSFNSHIYLGCVCKPQACHGDTIKRYLDIKAATSKVR